MGSLQTFEVNFRQPKKHKGIALSFSKEKTNEENDSDSEMNIEEMVLLLKNLKKYSININKINSPQLENLKKNLLIKLSL